HPPPSEIYTLSLHDALPIYAVPDVSNVELFQQLFQLGVPFRPAHAFAGFEDGHDVVPYGQFAEHGGFLGQVADALAGAAMHRQRDRKSTRLNSSHVKISYAV